MTTVASLNEALQVGAAWDIYWGATLANGGAPSLLRQNNELRPLSPDALRSTTPEQFFQAPVAKSRLTGAVSAAGVWAPGDAIVGRNVVEIGFGSGALAKALSSYTKRFFGIEASQLAVTIARSHSDEDARFAHLSEQRLLADYGGQFDTAIATSVFTHLNYAHTAFCLRLMKGLLRRNGLISAEFFAYPPGSIDGTVYDALGPLRLEALTAGYWFSEHVLQALANECDLQLLSVSPRQDLGKIFALFVRH